MAADRDSFRRRASDIRRRGRTDLHTAIAEVLVAAADLHPAYWTVRHPTIADLLEAIDCLADVTQDPARIPTTTEEPS